MGARVQLLTIRSSNILIFSHNIEITSQPTRFRFRFRRCLSFLFQIFMEKVSSAFFFRYLRRKDPLLSFSDIYGERILCFLFRYLQRKDPLLSFSNIYGERILCFLFQIYTEKGSSAFFFRYLWRKDPLLSFSDRQ